MKNQSTIRARATVMALLLVVAMSGVHPTESLASGGAWSLGMTFVEGPYFLTRFNDKTVFSAASKAGQAPALWITDGTKEGTSVVKSFPGGGDVGGYGPGDFFVHDDVLYFNAGAPRKGFELWRSDGTSAGTKMVKDLNPGIGDSDIRRFFELSGRLYFTAREVNQSNGRVAARLWVTDGTENGTQVVKTFTTVSGGLSEIHIGGVTVVADRAYMYAFDPEHGREVWVTDGTAYGTALVKDIYEGPLNADEVNVGQGSFDSSLVDPYFSHAQGRGFVGAAGYVFFTASDATRKASLWQTQGTEASTKVVKSLDGGSAVTGQPIGSVGNLLLFAGTESQFRLARPNDVELWRSDGTESGTYRLKDINPGASSSSPRAVFSMGGILYFVADDGVHGAELWRTDGTSEGTWMVRDAVPGSGGLVISLDLSETRDFTPIIVDGTAYFVARAGYATGPILWQTDGTESGTQQAPGALGEGVDSITVASRIVSGLSVGDRVRSASESMSVRYLSGSSNRNRKVYTLGERAPTRVRLTVTFSGDGSGQVKSMPAAIKCIADCAAAVQRGKRLTLTAVPSRGSRFVGWSGAGCKGRKTCTVSLLSAGAVTATFVRVSGR